MANGTRSVSKSNSRFTPTVYAAWISGATGAVPAMTDPNMQRSRGIVSITRNATAGNYTVVTERGFNDMDRFTCSIFQAATPPVLSGACTGIAWINNGSGATPSFDFQITTAPGVAKDPTTGDRVIIGFEPKYSTGLS